MCSALLSFGVRCRFLSCLELIWPLLSDLKVHLGLSAAPQVWREGVDRMEKFQVQAATQVAHAEGLG